jgi:hypothetical protein
VTGEAIQVQILGERPVAGFASRLAGETVVSDRPLTAGARRVDPPEIPEVWPQAEWTTVYRGPGLVAGAIAEVHAEACGDLARVTFADGERWLVGEEGWVRREAGEAWPSDEGAAVERALGAPMAVALAARGVYLLHASALTASGGVIALVAPTGGGKSTLAAAAGASADLGLTRIADDQLPVRLGREPAALPHFPQLKLPAHQGYPDDQPPQRPLRAIVTLDHAPGRPRPELRRLPPPEACLLLVRATVAARLLAPERLARHFAEAGAAAEVIPVYELRYASGPDGLRPALEALHRAG